MKFYCESQTLGDAVNKVIKATSNRTTNPILEGIKLSAKNDMLTLIATDGELAIEEKMNATVKVEGETVVPGKFFAEYIKKIDCDEIEMDLNEKNQLKVAYGDSEIYVQGYNPIEFPNIQKVENADFFDIKKVDLKDLIEKTIFSIAMDDSRPILKGCSFEISNEKIVSVALDGFRLAKAEKPVVGSSMTGSIIVPGRSLQEISKAMDDSEDVVRVFVQKNYLIIQDNNTKITTRLQDGDYLNYSQIIPSDFSTEIIINKHQFEDIIERASVLNRVGSDNSVRLTIKDNLLTMEAKNDLIGNATENINISMNGQEIVIGFNNKYLRDCLRVIKDDFIKIKFTSSINPCVITATEDSDYLFLILPLRIFY